jgi:hypothetical protein
MDIPAGSNLFEVMDDQPTVVQRLEHGSQRSERQSAKMTSTANHQNPGFIPMSSNVIS